MSDEKSMPTGSFYAGRPKGANQRSGSAYVLAALAVLVLTTLGVGALAVAWQERYESIKFKSEAVSIVVAEAGYEKAVYWMGQQQDMLSTLQNEDAGTSGSLNLLGGSCDYRIHFHTFAGSRPIYQITSVGRSGLFSRTVDVLVVQAVSGWDMGMCKVPKSSSSTVDVYFVTDETIDMPIHVNKQSDSPDKRDINVWGTPQFLRPVGMSESRHTAGGADKYAGVMGVFDGGICFDQPNSRITDAASVQTKVDRFRDSTKSQYQFKPVATGETVTNAKPAVQIEFFVGQDGKGKFIITNDCTVRGFNQGSDDRTYDYKINTTGIGDPYERYDIYAYHLKHSQAGGAGAAKGIEKTYVTQSIGDVESAPGGQIFVDGNVIIGGDRTEHDGDQVAKGRLTVVATGNIWVADSVLVAGSHDADGMPSADNPNILGLIAQGVIKVVDPGMSEYSYVDG